MLAFKCCCYWKGHRTPVWVCSVDKANVPERLHSILKLILANVGYVVSLSYTSQITNTYFSSLPPPTCAVACKREEKASWQTGVWKQWHKWQSTIMAVRTMKKQNTIGIRYKVSVCVLEGYALSFENHCDSTVVGDLLSIAQVISLLVRRLGIRTFGNEFKLFVNNSK